MAVIEDRVPRGTLRRGELETVVEERLASARVVARRFLHPDAVGCEAERAADEDGAEQKHQGEVLRALHCQSSSGGHERAKGRIARVAATGAAGHGGPGDGD